MRIERTRLDPKQRPPFDRYAILVGKTPRRVLVLADHEREHVGIERALIDRNLRHARNGGDDSRFDFHDANGTHDAGAGPGMTPGNFTAFERRCRRRQKRVAAHRNRRRTRMCRLADEPHHVSLQTKGPKDDAGGAIQRFEHRPLLDVHFEVGPCVDARELLPRVQHRVEQQTLIAKVARDLKTAGADEPRSLRPNRAPSSSAQSTRRSVTGGFDFCAYRRSASSATRTPSVPSSNPPLGTESRCPPTMTVLLDSPGSVIQLF